MAEKIVNTRILQKADKAATWTSNNPILKKGELGYETDTRKVKIGDGTTDWQKLSYIDASTLGGIASSSYATQNWVTDTAKAHDANLLDGHDSSYYATKSSLSSYATQSWVQNSATAHNAEDIDFVSSKTGVPVAGYALWPSTRANRLSFLLAKNVLVEQSTDGGKTWTDKVVSDSTKTGLFSQIRPGITIPLKNGKKSCDCMIRLTVTAMNFKNVPEDGTCAQKFAAWTAANVVSTERYCSLSGMFLWLSSNSDRIYCLVEKSTGATPNTWVKDGEGYCTGWSGADFIRLSDGVFGGGSGQTGNYWFRRFTFRTASTKNTFNDSDLSVNYTDATQSINEITAFGPNVWTAANSLMSTDRLYSWDINQNAFFPSILNASELHEGGTALANKYSSISHTHSFSGSQTLNWSCTPTGDLSMNNYKPEGTISGSFSGKAKAPTGSFTGTSKTISVSGTTTGSVSSTFKGTAKAPTGSFTGSSTTFTGSYTPAGTITHSVTSTSENVLSGLNATYEAASKRLTIDFNKASVVKTVSSGTASFSGTPVTLSVSGTPKGSVSFNAYTPEGTVSSAFSGASMTSSGTYKPEGTIAINAYTPEGTISSTFTGTDKAPTGSFVGKKHDHTATVTISGTTGAPK